ncbi:uncharacterized protein LOC125802987 [Astyanax mexicanus]|uniref:uncharacterized protein LOC125802987 n=1 Tax=Astyanax mexicanus TaxID=7994 RepID=UPI0020CB5951|nr:uncharacterized protein LOC125802987 [Astyanax mexicanus]
MRVTCPCGKICKNLRGLRIHQTRMGCTKRKQREQRTEPMPSIEPGETEEEQDPEQPYSVQNLHASQAVPSRPSEHRQVLWPAANKETEWRQLDEDVDATLEAVSKGGVSQRLQLMSSLIISIGTERFGIKQPKTKNPSKPNRREARISQLRKELKALKHQYRKSGNQEEERPALVELRSILRQKLISLRRAECHRKKGRERARKRTAFVANPFGFTKRLLGQKQNGTLVCPKEEMDQHLCDTYSDRRREEELPPCRELIIPPDPSVQFNIKEPTLAEVRDAVRAARTSAAPGPSGVPYKVYKHCPRLLERLWRLIKVVWRRGKIVDQWRYADGVWIPKEENAGNISQFPTISLLSVEGKIFFKILANRLTEYLLRNAYIDTSVQKGGVPGMPGCLEHTGVVTQLIREARENRGDTAVIWLDLANAYGSIPHKLVSTALTTYHVPEKINELIWDYYSNFSLRFTSGSVTSAWHRLEKGIITGCTISVVLFALAMNMMVKAAEVECRGPLSRSGIRQPPIRAFMDDLTVTATTVTGCRWLLRGLERIITLARMMFKPGKSRSLVLRKGRVVEKYRFNLDGVLIPSVSEKPVKSLGKIFDSTLKDKAAVQSTQAELKSWLSAVEKSGLPGKFKAWIYQHGILPRILWPLLIYEVPITIVEGWERNISQYLRRWLGLPKSLSSIALYGHTNKLQLPFTGLTEEFRVTRAREVLLYRDSADNRVSSAGITVRTGRKWKAQEAVEQAEARLRHGILIGSVAVGRTGLGSYARPRYDKAQGKERRQMVQAEIRAGVEEERRSRAVTMRQQGAWTNWDNASARKITWAELWKSEPARLKFLIQSVYDVLPSPSNLYCWGLAETPACPLCLGRGSLEHILSCCPKALGEGRYTWRHDQVLKAIADAVCSGIKESKHQLPQKRSITFIRAGEKPHVVHKVSSGLLTTAYDWQLKADLGRQLKFPEHIARTSLRPDLVLTSESTKQVVLLELTVPWEDRLEEAHERKKAKYLELVETCRDNGWRTRCEPIEVGCRGFLGQSVHRAFKLLGIRGLLEKRATRNISEVAEKASRWLWIKRGDGWSSALLEHKPGIDHPRLGRPGDGV